jgi:hypothetical protein
VGAGDGDPVLLIQRESMTGRLNLDARSPLLAAERHSGLEAERLGVDGDGV